MSIELDLVGQEMAEGGGSTEPPVAHEVTATAIKPDYIPPIYVRDDPAYGAQSPQSIYRFENGQGATVTRHQGFFFLVPVRFTGAEITSFTPTGDQENHGAEDVVQLVLNGIKNR